DHARAFGGADTNALIASPDFCGGCHTETYDASMSKVEGEQHVQTTWAEWKDSWYDRNDVTCQDCHMAPDPAGYVMALRQGKVAKPDRYTHNFVGANYLMFETALGSNLTFLRGGILPGLTDARNTELIAAQREATHALLRAAAGLELRGTRVSGEGLHLDIAVQNLGAGHNLPTGVTDQKHMWLEVVLRDAGGAAVYHSGRFDALIGETDPEAAAWMEKFLDVDGNRIRDHLTFQTAAISFERMPIAPKAEDVVGYDIPLPEGVQGPLRLEARLWYRAALQDLVYNIVKLDLVVPPFELVALQATIPLPPVAEPRP
ncbi:MAG TPA: hypothetical protein VGA75_12960, partial [Paracoccaceae bacterium]